MSVIDDILKDVPLPKMVPVHQKFDDTHIERDDIPATVQAQFDQEKIASKFKAGMKVGITVGSRGICNMDIIVKSIADSLRALGCTPVIIPAMGSHGGATAEGQKQVVIDNGADPAYTGCEILSSMETVYIGDTSEGRPVYFDKNALSCDGIVVLNRVKPHTDFRGPYESGIMKMLTIGLGKQYGAMSAHVEGFGQMHKQVPEYGKAMIKYAPISIGFAILENAYDKTRELIALTPDEIITEEPKLLERAKSYMPRILWDKCDVLVVDEIGKNISGCGMDPNITGRFQTPFADGGIDATRIAVLDLTPQSHGNGVGVGLADFTTKRFESKFHFEATVPNCLTNMVPAGVRLPGVVDSDELAIKACVQTDERIKKENAKIVRIKNTLSLSDIEVSEAMLPEAEGNPDITVTGEAKPFNFDENGNLF